MKLDGAKIRNFFEMMHGLEDKTTFTPPNIIKVPHYQRPYTWKKDNIEKLIDDWFKSQQGNTKNNNNEHEYFSGSVVTVSNDNTKTYSLIDGQQRFTTIYLANFIRFLISRIVLKDAFEQVKSTRLQAIINTYIDSANYLFHDTNNSKVAQSKDELQSIMHNFDDLKFSDDKQEEEREKYLNKVLCIVGLPSSSFIEIQDEKYFIEHKENLKRFFNNKSLTLEYDRRLFNESLNNVLINTVISLKKEKEVAIHFNRNFVENETKIEKQYKDSLFYIFESFLKIRNSSTKYKNQNNPFDSALSLIKIIEDFLKEVKVCVIQTGDANDAYTLFEVLNDRSLALSDLDLIKNLFYKYFVEENNEKLSHEEVDDVIQYCDKQWIESIFSQDMADFKKRLVAYFSVSFITGNHDISTKNNQGLRAAVEKYLNPNDITKNYNIADIKRDFNIFKCCKIIIDQLDLKFQHKQKDVFFHELNQNATQLTKTFHFVYALGQEGVLSGLVNYILKSLQTTDFDPIKFEKQFKKLLDVNNNSDTLYDNIQNQSKQIWQASMMAKDFRTPKVLSEKLVKSNNLLTTNNSQTINLSIDEFNQLEQDFKDWLSNWSYANSGSSSIKVRSLFSRLIKLNFVDGKLQETNISGGNISKSNISELELDHIEPNNISSSSANSYFEHPDRANFINGLGNMMPLTKRNNSSKGNKPAKLALAYYESDGLGPGNHLYDITKKFFEENNVDGIPKESFFSKRKNYLIDILIQAVHLSN